MKEIFLKYTVCLLAFAVFTSGCASILNDDYQRVNVSTSNNKSVKGTIDGIPFEAPSIVSIKRSKADKIVLVDNPACSKQTLAPSTVDNKFFINVLSGGTFGSSTDYATEKMWKFQDSIVIPCS